MYAWVTMQRGCPFLRQPTCLWPTHRLLLDAYRASSWWIDVFLAGLAYECFSCQLLLNNVVYRERLLRHPRQSWYWESQWILSTRKVSFRDSSAWSEWGLRWKCELWSPLIGKCTTKQVGNGYFYFNCSDWDTYVVRVRICKTWNGVRFCLLKKVDAIDLLERFRVPDMEILFIPSHEWSM